MQKLLHPQALKAYSLCAGAILANTHADAQIIYTDVSPDDTIYINDVLPLNLDNDGYAELYVGAYADANKYWQVIGPAYGAWDVLTGDANLNYFKALSSGYSICKSIGPWDQIGLSAQEYIVRVKDHKLFGYFEPDNQEHFIAFGWPTGNWPEMNLGWVRLSLSPDTSYMIVKDYAINFTPDACIKAGEGIPSASCTDNYEPNNTASVAALIPVNKRVNGLIENAGDKDWFQFTVPAGKTNVRLVLSQLPVNYNVALYDEELNKLATSAHKGKMNDTIVCNNADPFKKYYAVVRGENINAFDPTDCYSMRIEASEIPFRLPSFNDHSGNPVQFYVYPDPATTEIRIPGLDETPGEEPVVAVFDISGRQVMASRKYEGALNVSALPPGFYFLHIQDKGGISISKFEIIR